MKRTISKPTIAVAVIIGAMLVGGRLVAQPGGSEQEPNGHLRTEVQRVEELREQLRATTDPNARAILAQTLGNLEASLAENRADIAAAARVTPPRLVENPPAAAVLPQWPDSELNLDGRGAAPNTVGAIVHWTSGWVGIVGAQATGVWVGGRWSAEQHGTLVMIRGANVSFSHARVYTGETEVFDTPETRGTIRITGEENRVLTVGAADGRPRASTPRASAGSTEKRGQSRAGRSPMRPARRVMLA
ncbi:MAG: hypothetical protein EXR68_03345 [Dehalococcoidia bacterium]|nr:hypothetical protein [Dehalococcoidia bacterium]